MTVDVVEAVESDTGGMVSDGCALVLLPLLACVLVPVFSRKAVLAELGDVCMLGTGYVSKVDELTFKVVVVWSDETLLDKAADD